MPKNLVVDSSALIFYDRQGQLEAYLELKKRQNFRVVISRAVAKEIIEEPQAFAESIRGTAPEFADRILASVGRFSAAVEQGLIAVETVDYRKYSKVMDKVRHYLSKLDASRNTL